MPFKHPGFNETVSDKQIAATNEKVKKVKCDVCGGTGGHVYPALSVAREYKKFGTDVYWIGRKNSYCVVIPVINEGERIKNLFNRLQKCNISAIADIIIVDGGSTDGHLKSKLSSRSMLVD